MILEKGELCQQKMKGNVKQEYLKLIKFIINSKLNAKNTFEAIITLAVSMTCDGPGIVEWTKDKLECLDKKSRKMVTKIC